MVTLVSLEMLQDLRQRAGKLRQHLDPITPLINIETARRHLQRFRNGFLVEPHATAHDEIADEVRAMETAARAFLDTYDAQPEALRPERPSIPGTPEDERLRADVAHLRQRRDAARAIIGEMERFGFDYDLGSRARDGAKWLGRAIAERAERRGQA